MANWDLKREIEDLLSREAHLLDERRFTDWLDLFTEDALYILPLRENVQGDVPPAGHPIMRDDKNMMRARVASLNTGFMNAETPVSMTCHIVANVIVDRTQSTDEVDVRSTFLVRQVRKLREEALWSGRRHDRMRFEGASWKIARREVQLDATVLPRGISIFF